MMMMMVKVIISMIINYYDLYQYIIYKHFYVFTLLHYIHCIYVYKLIMN